MGLGLKEVVLSPALNMPDDASDRVTLSLAKVSPGVKVTEPMTTSEPFMDATTLGARVIAALEKTELVLSPDDDSMDDVSDDDLAVDVMGSNEDSDPALLKLISVVQLPLKNEELRLESDAREDADASVPEEDTSVGSLRGFDVAAPAVV